MDTVLLIESDEKIVKLNTDVLIWYKYDVVTAHSLAESEKLLSEKIPDLIVLDTDMPDGSGLDYCRKLKTEYNLPIILISGDGRDKDELTGLKAGADDYIVKPYNISGFIARVESRLNKYRRDKK